jgi:hypothetical protein
MRVVFWLLGTIAIAAGFFNFVPCKSHPEVDWSSWPGGIPLIIAGLLYCLAGAKNYRGHWSFAVGVALLCLTTVFVAAILSGQIAIKGSTDILFALCVLGSAFTGGTLSLWSGHKLHIYALERECWTKSQPDQNSLAATKTPSLKLRPSREI